MNGKSVSDAALCDLGSLDTLPNLQTCEGNRSHLFGETQ